MFVDSQLLMHKKSNSVCELAPAIKKSSVSPQTSPLLRRALSPSEVRKKGTKPRRSITLPRDKEVKRPAKVVSIITPQQSFDMEEEGEDVEEATTVL